MANKGTMVRLQVGSRIQAFNAEHAERLLRMSNNGGWHIADDENLELTKNGFRPKKTKRGVTTAE